MEHLNRRFKTVIRGMGANVNPITIQKAGKALAPVHQVCQQFELQTSNQVHSDHHPYPTFGKDFETTLQALEEENVFVPVSIRQHSSFSCGLMETLDRTDWLKKVGTTIKHWHSYLVLRPFSRHSYNSWKGNLCLQTVVLDTGGISSMLSLV